MIRPKSSWYSMSQSASMSLMRLTTTLWGTSPALPARSSCSPATILDPPCFSMLSLYTMHAYLTSTKLDPDHDLKRHDIRIKPKPDSYKYEILREGCPPIRPVGEGTKFQSQLSENFSATDLVLTRKQL